jgi:hypothetical protein
LAVSFMDYDLGYIDLEEKTLQPLDNPLLDIEIKMRNGRDPYLVVSDLKWPRFAVRISVRVVD